MFYLKQIWNDFVNNVDNFWIELKATAKNFKVKEWLIVSGFSLGSLIIGLIVGAIVW